MNEPDDYGLDLEELAKTPRSTRFVPKKLGRPPGSKTSSTPPPSRLSPRARAALARTAAVRAAQDQAAEVERLENAASGGRARAAATTPEQRSRVASAASAVRWSKIPAGERTSPNPDWSKLSRDVAIKSKGGRARAAKLASEAP
ncbi:MAG: hypothetical protein JWP01_3384 [Myxococcales bacterium]|nr:hypothetical protein [Myxococcales bacterium]